MASYLLPSLASTPAGTHMDFVCGDDGRQGGALICTEIDVDDPIGERIIWSGFGGGSLIGKVTGGTLRLCALDTGQGFNWVVTQITGQWEMNDGAGTIMGCCGEVFSTLKRAQQTIDNSDVLVNVTGLSLPYSANGRRPFHFKFFVPFETTGGASGFKFSLDCGAPSQYSAQWQVLDQSTNTVLQQIDLVVPATFSASFPALLTVLKVEGIIENGAGILQLQFAQQVADAAALIIHPFADASGFYV